MNALLVLATLSGLPASLGAPTSSPCPIIQIDECTAEGGGVDLGLTRGEVGALATSLPAGSSPSNPKEWYQYSAVIDCRGNTPGNPKDVLCSHAVTFCEENVPNSEGPYSIIYRRVADSDGPVSDWERVGPTCHTASVPARSGDPEELTDAMILEQFHRTDFALPQLVIEPADQTVAVNMPAYFELVWPEEGFEPGEVDVTELAGHQVRIRPVFNEVTYQFGDGDSQGPTTSQGGGFPNGDITHVYESTGAVTPSVTVVYGGEVSVDGDDWMTIPGTVQIEGPATEVTVVTSRNRLYDD